jgi:hypothetical protein
MILGGEVFVLVGHDMPLIEIGDQARNIKLNLLGRRSATHRNRIITHPILLKQPPQSLHKTHKVSPIRRISHIPRIPVIHTIGAEILPIDGDALERRPGLEEGDNALGEGLAA